MNVDKTIKWIIITIVVLTFAGYLLFAAMIKGCMQSPEWKRLTDIADKQMQVYEKKLDEDLKKVQKKRD